MNAINAFRYIIYTVLTSQAIFVLLHSLLLFIRLIKNIQIVVADGSRNDACVQCNVQIFYAIRSYYQKYLV
jgi:hypothetical protein